MLSDSNLFLLDFPNIWKIKNQQLELIRCNCNLNIFYGGFRSQLLG